jgi:hypothetical protein
VVELGGVYKQNADLTRDYSLRMSERVHGSWLCMQGL